jgi:serine/threonine protein kinase
MTRERWQRLKPLFYAALEKDRSEQSSFIAAACADDPELLSHLTRLVSEAERTIGPLDNPVWNVSPFIRSETIPGTVLARRFRIASFVGRGGMGEVYRAEDLKLNQTVALKMLPLELTKDPAWLSRFLLEVRTARTVTHPNVCRVHDIFDATTKSGIEFQFLTMEYVDGEDLSSLMRRSGRLPAPKALEIAGQITTGLAAVHNHGIIHRDIKPANVLIDARGQAKLVDFGLAVITGAHGAAELAGTPGYIAPEILRGESYSVRSDLYSLGVLLVELFTGNVVSDPSKIEPTILHKYSAEFPDVSSRVIVRCLATDPSERPSTTAEILKVLPVDNPLEAALARGEIPSPELVAAAGSSEPLSRPKALALFLAIIICLIGTWLAAPFGSFLGVATPLLSPAQMEKESRLDLNVFGYSSQNIPHVSILTNNEQLLDYLSYKPVAQKLAISTIGQGSLVLTYRQSPTQSLLPKSIVNGIAGSEESSFASSMDPVPLLPDMALVQMDSNGHILQFLANPHRGPATAAQASESAQSGPDWSQVVKATGLDHASLQEIASGTHTETAAPPFAFTEYRRWRGNYPGHPENPVTLEAAAWGKRVNWIDVRTPWNQVTTATGMPAIEKAGISAIILASLVLAVLVARRNLQLGRGDLRSAFRLAAFSTSLTFLGILASWHSDDGTATDRIQWTLLQSASALSVGAGIWLAYIAIEPFARRHIPRLLVTSSQLLQGRWRSPLIGREMLFGFMLAAVSTLLFQLTHAWTWRHLTGASLNTAPAGFLAGGQQAVYSIAWHISSMPKVVAQYAVLFVVLRVLLRRPLAASIAFFLCMSLVPTTRGSVLAALPTCVLIGGSAAWLYSRASLVAAASYFFVMSTVDRCVWPHTTDSWMLAPMIESVSLVLILVAAGFYLGTGMARRSGDLSPERAAPAQVAVAG